MSLTFDEHIAIIQGNLETPVVVNKDNILDMISQCAAVLDEQNIPQEGRFISFPVLIKQPMSKKRRIQKKWFNRNLKAIMRRRG